MRTSWILVLLLGVLPGGASASGCLHYGAPTVAIRGHVERGDMLGKSAVNSRSSAALYSWYFETDAPICVTGRGNTDGLPLEGTRRFEIWPPPKQHDFSQYLGRLVQIQGNFLPALIPHFHAYLIFATTSVRTIDDHGP